MNSKCMESFHNLLLTLSKKRRLSNSIKERKHKEPVANPTHTKKDTNKNRAIPTQVIAPSHKARFLCAARDTGAKNICQKGSQSCITSRSSLAKTKLGCQERDQRYTRGGEGCAKDYLSGWELLE